MQWWLVILFFGEPVFSLGAMPGGEAQCLQIAKGVRKDIDAAYASEPIPPGAPPRGAVQVLCVTENPIERSKGELV